MKKYSSFFKFLFAIFAAFVITGCVHDDIYDNPNLQGYQCQDLTANMTIAQVKALHGTTAYVFPDANPNDPSSVKILEGYVSSSDETGNIYKTIYIQDAPENPTHGFTISVDAVSTYTKFPQGSKIYIKLNGLAIGTYGGLVQLGVRDANAIAAGVDAVSRIPESTVPSYIIRSCAEKIKIVPKVLTYAQFASNQDLLGALVKLENVEFDGRVLCTTYAPDGTSVDKKLNQQGSTLNVVVRNSGFASFANQILPAGKGSFVGIFSKFSSTHQFYINRVSDLDMEGDKNGDGVDEHFPRTDGITKNPCTFDINSVTAKTVAEVKQMYTGGNWTQITGDYYLKAQVVANDATNNLYKYIYVEDATGGLRVNINKLDLFADNRFKLGKDLYIKLKDLYVRNVNGEMQLGGLFNNNTQFGQIEEVNVYKHFFDTNTPARPVVPKELSITQFSNADVGRWIKIKDLQFIDADLGKTYTNGTSATNRTLEDCAGNTVLLRTSGLADFGTSTTPLKPGVVEVEIGKGDVYAILSVFNGTYQLWITRLSDIDLDNPRCDGTVYTPLPVIYSENFAAGGFSSDWTTVNVTGSQVWNTSNQGNGTNYYAIMNGYAGGNNTNEDWLISKSVSLVGKSKATVSFTSDVRYSGNALQVYATENYTGNPATTTWVLLPAALDTNTGAFGDWVSSGNVNLSAFLGKNVRIAFKYTSTTSAAATWQVDDFKIKAE